MKKKDTLHHENREILQEHSGLQQLVKAKMKKIKLRRVIAILSCFVLLLTVNQLKFEADTLQRVPACNLCEHVHTASCYQDGELICGLPEHEHTDACYQQRPVNPEPTVFDEFMDLNSQVVLASPSEDVNLSVENVDESVSETTIELGDDGYSDVNDDSYNGLEVEMDLDDSYDEEQADDGNGEPSIDSGALIDNEPSEENEAVYTMPGDSVTFLSDVLNSVGLSLTGITSVGEIVEDDAAEAHLSIEAVEGVDSEYALRVVKDFDRVTLGVITDSDIVEIVLKDGVAAATDAEEAGEPAAASDLEGEEYGDDTGLDDEYQETVEPVIENEGIGNTPVTTETEMKQTEVEEEQTEVGDSDPAEEAVSALVEVTSTEAEDEASEDEASEKEQSEDAGVEDATGDAFADEDATGDSSAVEDEQNEDKQTVDGGDVQSEGATDDTSVKDGETTETEEKQDTDEGHQDDEEQTDEEQSDDEAKDPSDGEVEDAADGQVEEEQQAEDGSEVEDEQQGDAEQADDEQTVIRRHVSLDFSAYIVADSHTVYLYDDVMNAVLVNTAEIDSVDGVVVTTVDADEAPDGEADEPTEDASGEDKTDGEAQEDSAQAEPVEDSAQAEQKARVLIITGDGEYKLDGTAYAVSGLVLPGDEEAVEEPSDAEEDETEPSTDDETVEEEPSEGEPAADQAPVVERVVVGYKLEYDLSEVDAYPISLRALMDQAEPVYEEVVIEPGVSADAEEAADNGEADATDGEDAADGDETVDGEHVDADAVTEDTAVEETVDAAPAVEDVALEETADAETAVADAAEEVIEYDTALLTVEQTEEDWLITPAADFEETQVIIGLYDIIFLNGKAPITYPAMVFDGATEYINVHVEAPEGAFPEGTTMHLEDVEDEQALTEIGDAAVTDDDFVEVQRVHAVDITFQDVDGQEIEPLLPINVVMTLREIEQDEEAVVVHMNDAGETEVVNTTLPTEEMPVETVPFGEAETGAEESAPTEESARSEESADQSTNSAPGEIAFTTDAFSIYGMVVTKKIETKYIPATGETYKIVVSYGPEAMIPAGATLEVSEIEGEEAADYLARTEEALDNTKAVATARFFDIRIMYEGEEVQPAAPVKVQVMLEEDAAEDAVPCAVHFADEKEEIPEIVDAVENGEAIEFNAPSFSVWGVVYTVDFHYEVNGQTYTFTLPGGGFARLSDLIVALGVEKNTEEEPTTDAVAEEKSEENDDFDVEYVTPFETVAPVISEETRKFLSSIASVTFSDPALLWVGKVEAASTAKEIKAENSLVCQYSGELTEEQIDLINAQEIEAGDWALVSLLPFTSNEALTVTMDNGDEFTVLVTDTQKKFISNSADLDGKEYALLTVKTVKDSNWNDVNAVVLPVDQQTANDDNDRLKAEGRAENNLTVTTPTWKFEKADDTGKYYISSGGKYLNINRTKYSIGRNDVNNIGDVTLTDTPEQALYAVPYTDGSIAIQNTDGYRLDFWNNNLDHGFGAYKNSWQDAQEHQRFKLVPIFKVEEGKPFVIYHQDQDGNYRVLGVNEDNKVCSNSAEMDALSSAYQWVFQHRYDENGDFYYEITSVYDRTKHISLTENPYNSSLPGSYLETGGQPTVVVNSWDNSSDASNGIQLSFQPYGYQSPIYLKHAGGENNFFYALTANMNDTNDANQTKMFLYEQQPVGEFSFIVKTENPDYGLVWAENATGTNGGGLESLTTSALKATVNGEEGMFNQYKITAFDVGPEGNNNSGRKYVFDHWNLNGNLVSTERTIEPQTLEIPESDAVLEACYRRNDSYIPMDADKHGSFIDKKDLNDWLNKLKSSQMPLDPDGCTKTAEIYDYENRIYRVDLTARSSLVTFNGTIDLGFIIDVSQSMKFPSRLTAIQGKENVNLWHINDNYDNKKNYLSQRSAPYYIIADESGTATVCAIKWNGSVWQWKDASKADSNYADIKSDRNSMGSQFHDADATKFKAGIETLYQIYEDTDQGKQRKDYLESSLNNTTQTLKDILNILSLSQNTANDPDVRIAWNTFCNYLPEGTGERQTSFVSAKTNINLQYEDSAYAGGTSTDIALLDAVGVKRSDVIHYSDYFDSEKYGSSDNHRWIDGREYAGQGKYHKWNCVDYDDSLSYTPVQGQGFNWNSSNTKYAVLITDGAPQRGGKPVNPQYVKKAAKQLEDRGIKLITVGLSMGNVDVGRVLLYDIAEKENGKDPYFFEANSGDELQYVLYSIIQTILEDCNVYGDVTDTVGEAFYPVNKLNGKPLVDGDWIDKDGNYIPVSDRGSLSADAVHGVIGYDTDSDTYTVTWENQKFTHEEEGWHGTVYVKAKEDFLGGNVVKTNKGDAVIEAKQYSIGNDTTKYNLASERGDYTYEIIEDLDHPETTTTVHSRYKTTIDDLKSPRVNVNELNFTENSTEWTVYVGTNVDPLPQIQALYDQIKIEEVVTANNREKPEQVLDETSLRFTVEESESDARTPTGTPVTFNLKDLITKLEAEAGQPTLDWDELIRLSDQSGDANTGITYRYDIYTGNYSAADVNDRDYPGTINIKLVKTIVDEGLSNPYESHPADIVGSPVERYTLKVSFSPDYEYLPANQKGNGQVAYHTGLWGLGQPGAAAGTETSNNNHIINVLRKAMELRKVNDDGELIDGARFKIYKKDASDNVVADTVRTVLVNNGVYTIDPVIPDVDTSVPGSYWKYNTTFYIQETQTPDADYKLFDGEIAVNLAMSDQVTYLEDGTQPCPYNWTQIPTLTATGNADHVTVGYLEKYYIDPDTGNQTGRVEETIGITVAQKNELDIDIDVIKTDADNTPLAGAIFKLEKGGTLLRSEDYQVVKRDTTDAITIDSNGCFEIPIEGVTLKGLGVGTYTLTEVVAPSRYVLSRHPVTFTIQSNADRTKRVTFENTVEAPENTGDGEPEAEGEDEPGSSSDPGSPTDAQIAASRSLTIPNQPMTEFKVVKDWGENADPNSKQAIVYELYKADRGTGHNRTSIGTFMLDANGGYMLDTTDYLVAHNEQLSSTPWTMSHYADTSAGAPEYWFEVEEKGLYTVTGTGETATWSVTTIDTNYLKVSYKAQPDGDYRDGTLKESWKDDWGWALLDIWDSHEGTPQLTIRNLGALKLTKLVTVNEGDPASLNKPLQDAADGDYYFSIVGPVTRVTRYVYICISGGRMQYYSVLHPEDEGCTLDWADDNSVYHYDWVNGYCLDGTYWGQYYLDDNDESHYLGQWSGYTDRSVREALIGDLPVGEYVITERRPSNGTTLASITGGKLYEDQNGGAAHNNANLTNGTVTVDVAAGETFDATGHVSVTYTNNKNTGALRLKKIVTYNSGECDKLPDTDANRRKLDGDYPFSISGPAPSNEVIQYVKIRIENGEEVCYLLSKVNTDAAWRLAVQDYTNNTNEGVSWKRADPLGLKLEHLLPGDYVVTELGFTTDSGLITTMAKIYGGKEVEDAGNDAYNGANLDTRTVTLTVTADDNPEMESEAFVAYTNDYSEGSLGLKKLVEAHTSYPVNGNKGYFDSSYFDFTVNGPVKADGTPESDAITKYVRIYVKNTGDNSVVLNYYYEVKDSSSEFEGVDSATQLQSGQNPYVPIPNLKYGDYIITESGAWSVPNAPAGTDVYLKGVLLRCYKGAQGMDYIDCHPDMANRSVRVSVDNTHDGDVVVVIFTNELEPSTATIKKQVTDLNDSEESTSIQYNENPWYDSADYDINDRVPYRVTGYLPQKIYRDPARTHYWYQVVDEMYNLDFDESSARMYAFVKGPTDVQGSWFDVSRYFRHYAVTSLGNNGTRIKTDLVDIKTIKIGNRVYKWDAAQDTHGSAYPYGDPVTIADQPITPADIQYLQLRYMAVLKDTAAFGATGNMNQAKLNYGENNDVLSSTDWDKNKVFTYKLSFAKQDENGTAMPGATFTLYKKYLSYDATGKGLYAGAKIIDGTEYPVLSKTPFTAGQSVATGKHEEYYIQVGEEQGGANVTTFEWNGIDDGRYLLEETGAPTGYQKQMLAFSIAADHDLRHDDPPLNWIRVPKQNETIVPEAAGYIGSAELNTGIITLKSGESATGIKNYPYPDIDLEKIDQDTRNTQSVKHLAGAQFQILKWNGSQYASYVPYMPTTSSTGSSGSSSSASSGLLPGEVVTDDNGLAVFPKVEPGEYVIKETKVPDGYIKLVTNDIYINVAYDATKNVHTITWYEEAYDGTNDSSRTKITDTSETLGVTFTQATAANGDNPASDAMFTVGNTPGARLPNSGGPGTTLFYVVGSIITLLAAVLLVTKRRSYDGD